MLLTDSHFQLTENGKRIFIEDLSQLHTEFGKYFPETTQHHWIRDSFNAYPSLSFANVEEEQLINLSSGKKKKKH